MCENYHNMLDYMSHFSPPNREQAVDQIYNSIKYTTNRFSAEVSDKYLIYLIYKSFDDFSANEPRGSLSAWHTQECKRVIAKVFDEFALFIQKKRRLKGALRSLVLLNLIYKDTLEIHYAPNGAGMKTAMDEFTHLSYNHYYIHN